jgi:egghead protein (zeste-white 4 protein)
MESAANTIVEVLKLLKYPAYLVWGIYEFYVILGLVGFFLYKPSSRLKRINQSTKEKSRNNFEFVIVSIAARTVRYSLFECVYYTRNKFPHISLSVLIDEGAQLNMDLWRAVYDSINVVRVPKRYRTDLLGKGRAMNYFIENHVDNYTWYSFIDDDNLILDDNFLHEIQYYENLGYVAFNPSIVPRHGKSKFTFIMDFIREYDDKTIFRFFTGLLRTPLLGIHGEFLTVKGNTLKEIGYGNRSLTEDFRFAIELVKRGKKTWQSSSEISIKSANSIRDLCKQRGRWFKGIFIDLKFCPPLMKIIVGMRLLIWLVGIVGSWALLPLWIIWNDNLIFYFLIGGLYPWIIFIYKIIKTKQPFYYLLLIPIFGIIESISFWFGVKQKKFVVIDKS